MDGEFKKARSKRRSLEKRWKRTGKEDDHVKYVSQREHCSKLVISKKEAYYSKLINSAGNRQKALFQVVEKALDNEQEKILPSHEDP